MKWDDGIPYRTRFVKLTPDGLSYKYIHDGVLFLLEWNVYNHTSFASSETDISSVWVRNTGKTWIPSDEGWTEFDECVWTYPVMGGWLVKVDVLGNNLKRLCTLEMVEDFNHAWEVENAHCCNRTAS